MALTTVPVERAFAIGENATERNMPAVNAGGLC